MNAKNDTPAESEPTKPAAKSAAKPATKPAAAANTSAPSAETPAAKPAAKPAKAGAKKAAEPAKSAAPAEKAATPPAAPAAPAPAASPAAAPAAEPAAAPAATQDPAATGEVAPAVDPAATGEAAPVAGAPVQTVYVTAPTPPKPKGNRGIGILLSVAAAVVFALVYAGVAAILIMTISPDAGMSAVSAFFTNSLFYVPVLVFLVAMILWALLANRTGWWSWVIGSLVVAALTYFASIGIFLLMEASSLAPSQVMGAFGALAASPALIAAALVARECAIWFGAAISKRGRKVRERNYATWQAFENEQAQKRAELGGAAAA